MSRSWAPAPRGQPVHSTKIRVIGADVGTPAYQAVLDRHLGVATQFLNAQHQRAQLGALAQHKASIATDGATITYHNINGQDTLTIDVTAQQASSAASAQPNPAYWDWALVELVIPGMGQKTNAELSAFLTKTFKGQQVWAWNNQGGYNSADKILRYGDACQNQVGPASADPTDIVASLLVDLRKFQHPGAVSIDLHGFMYPFSNYGIPTDSTWPYTVTNSQSRAHRGRDASPYSAPYDVGNVSKGAGPIAVDTTAGTYDALTASFPELVGEPYQIVSSGGPWNDGSWTMQPYWNNPSYPGAWHDDIYLNPANSDPNTFTAHFAASYSDVYDYWDTNNYYIKTRIREGVTGTDPNGVTVTSNVIPQTNGQFHLQMYDYVDYWIPTCHVYPTKDAQLRCCFFKGNPPDAASFWSHNSAASYWQWELSKKYPQRPNEATLPDTALVVGQDYPTDDTLGNKFGQPMLGTLLIDPSMATGGFKFKRA